MKNNKHLDSGLLVQHNMLCDLMCSNYVSNYSGGHSLEALTYVVWITWLEMNFALFQKD